MGFASIESVQVQQVPLDDKGAPAAKQDDVAKTATPTYLSGESLTFPLVTGVGSAALTIIGAIQGEKPDLGIVIVVAVICGLLVTIWGLIDARAVSTSGKKAGAGDIFKRVVVGVLNTILLTSALWGAVEAGEAAFGGSD